MLGGGWKLDGNKEVISRVAAIAEFVHLNDCAIQWSARNGILEKYHPKYLNWGYEYEAGMGICQMPAIYLIKIV